MGYYFRAFTNGGVVPPCLDGGGTGLNAGRGEIPCSDAANGPYGNLCNHPSFGSHVQSACPAACGDCIGGTGDASAWGSLMQLDKPKKKKKGGSGTKLVEE